MKAVFISYASNSSQAQLNTESVCRHFLTSVKQSHFVFYFRLFFCQNLKKSKVRSLTELAKYIANLGLHGKTIIIGRGMTRTVPFYSYKNSPRSFAIMNANCICKIETTLTCSKALYRQSFAPKRITSSLGTK